MRKYPYFSARWDVPNNGYIPNKRGRRGQDPQNLAIKYLLKVEFNQTTDDIKAHTKAISILLSILKKKKKLQRKQHISKKEYNHQHQIKNHTKPANSRRRHLTILQNSVQKIIQSTNPSITNTFLCRKKIFAYPSLL